MISKLSVLFTFVLLVTNCNQNNLSNSDSDRLGISISIVGNYDSTSTMYISTTSKSEVMPIVFISGKEIDPIGFFYWREQVKQNAYIGYQIIWQNDTLSDSIWTPPIIDSLFCNNIYIPKYSYDNPTAEIKFSKEIKLTWKHNKNVSFFELNFSSRVLTKQKEYFTNYKYDTLTLCLNDTFSAFPVNIDFNVISIGMPLLSRAQPNIESQKMFSFYKSSGSEYYGRFSIVK